MEVDRLHRVARQEMDGVERLGQPQQVLVVGPVADPAAAVEVGDVGRAADGPEGDPVATELEVARGVAGMERELRRRGRDQLGDHRRVEADPLLIRARRSRRRRAAPRARRRRGSPSRSRTGRAASRHGSTRARRPTRPRSGGSAGAAGPTAAAAAAALRAWPSRPPPRRRRSPSPAAVSMSVTRVSLRGIDRSGRAHGRRPTQSSRSPGRGPAGPRHRYSSDRCCACSRMRLTIRTRSDRQDAELEPRVVHAPGA